MIPDWSSNKYSGSGTGNEPWNDGEYIPTCADCKYYSVCADEWGNHCTFGGFVLRASTSTCDSFKEDN